MLELKITALAFPISEVVYQLPSLSLLWTTYLQMGSIGSLLSSVARSFLTAPSLEPAFSRA